MAKEKEVARVEVIWVVDREELEDGDEEVKRQLWITTREAR